MSSTIDSVKRWLEEKTNYFKKYASSYLSEKGVPFLLSMIVLAVTTFIKVWTNTIVSFSAIPFKDIFLWAFFSYIILDIIVSFRKYGANFESLKKIREWNESVPGPLQNYAEGIIIDEVSNCYTFKISPLMNPNGLKKEGLTDKITIINSIINDYKNDITVDSRFWATTLDSPSEMIRSHYDFFSIQKLLLKRCKNKRRLVVITLEQLIREISDEDSRSDLEDFIKWHLNEVNNFDLRFVLMSKKKFWEEAKNSISPILPNHYLTDFAVFDNSYVFGEIKLENDELTDDTIQISSKGKLNFYSKKRGNKNIINDYSVFYNKIWNRRKKKDWPILYAKQVLSEIERIENKIRYQDDIYNDYEQAFEDTDKGELFFKKVCEFIKNSSKKIIAVDLAHIKDDVSAWSHQESYGGFRDATIEASQNGADCTRIYVINDKKIESKEKCKVDFKNVFKKQIDENVKVYLAPLSSLSKKNIPVHDFIIADGSFCFTLYMEQKFSIQDLRFEKNLDSKNNCNWYTEIFDEIKSNEFTKNINDWNENDYANFRHIV